MGGSVRSEGLAGTWTIHVKVIWQSWCHCLPTLSQSRYTSSLCASPLSLSSLPLTLCCSVALLDRVSAAQRPAAASRTLERTRDRSWRFPCIASSRPALRTPCPAPPPTQSHTCPGRSEKGGRTCSPSRRTTHQTASSRSPTTRSVSLLLAVSLFWHCVSHLTPVKTDRDAMDTFRAMVAKQERSKRTLELTKVLIHYNPAHYSVWCVALDFRNLAVPLTIPRTPPGSTGRTRSSNSRQTCPKSWTSSTSSSSTTSSPTRSGALGACTLVAEHELIDFRA